MKPITMLYLNGQSATFEKVNPSLERYYDMLKCDFIDIVSLKIGGQFYDIICDDEALLKQPPHYVSVISAEGHPMLIGNILVCNSTENGCEATLTPSDIVNLLGSLCWTKQYDETIAALIAD